ncbi:MULTISPECIES: CDF family zinc efflux transporter CzrB [Staphylococcus]|uniref:CDF family zinc efflux transporter CzrB n=1 Tax=Staphylococcus TaxID=1279 RepID=UPI0003960C1D|nr:CDF family zinc efflux transporter CzrB [Staphylococcus equorum]ANR68664.1 cation transporter [Staphylococcus equorum]ERH34365.1 cation transporter [Staphylococcus equorum UMC-CNS-924]MCE5008299.1 CDF family zinc efflux transporter CzrB [Staphylococcus equorum]MCE5048866.1 CDF family zinc efflux transporter CzrB [Staphylococcus equorum]MCM3073518.1 CDF family zinc efflux transporter CzrB [Staphylococcus equorum]
MSESEHHGHNHAHGHVHTNNKKILLISFLIIGIFMIVEIIGGFVSNSLALLSDGLHMFSDTISLGVALLAFIYAERHANKHKTFGYKRFEILAALFNGVTLFVIGIIIIVEAIGRFFDPQEVQSTEMFIISVTGLIVNIIVAYLMFKAGDTSHNINMRGAFLHVIGDLLGSVGAIIAAVLIWNFNLTIADPIASIIVSVLIIKSSWGITKSSLNILMEGTPSDVNMNQVFSMITEEEKIKNIHDCHVWTISNEMNALSCHAVVPNTMTIEEGEVLLNRLEHKLEHLNIQHMTIQLETTDHLHDNNILCSAIYSKQTTHHSHSH